jgi:hypothetical protein
MECMKQLWQYLRGVTVDYNTIIMVAIGNAIDTDVQKCNQILNLDVNLISLSDILLRSAHEASWVCLESSLVLDIATPVQQ